MWKKSGTPVPIDASQVVVGLYVWLDLSWDEHPFFASRLMVKTAKDIAIIQSLDAQGKIYYHPEQSTVQPGPLVAKPATPDEVDRPVPVVEVVAESRELAHQALPPAVAWPGV